MWYKVSEPGKWRGECAELCGSGHYTMQILVQAVTPDEYQTWATDQLAKAKATPSPSAAAGAASSPSPGAPASPAPSGYASPSASPYGSPSPRPSS
jgi:heme/copper-type cytochrome/quinol oxidase subunit 2